MAVIDNRRPATAEHQAILDRLKQLSNGRIVCDDARQTATIEGIVPNHATGHPTPVRESVPWSAIHVLLDEGFLSPVGDGVDWLERTPLSAYADPSLPRNVLAAIGRAEQDAWMDGAHEKQQVIDHMIRHLLGADAYAAWVERYNEAAIHEDGFEWDTGQLD